MHGYFFFETIHLIPKAWSEHGIFFCPVHNAPTPCSLQAFGIRCIWCARIFFFALHEPLQVHLPCLNFVLFFTYHHPPPLPPARSPGAKDPQGLAPRKNKHGGGENSMDCGEAFIRGLVVSQTIQKQLQ